MRTWALRLLVVPAELQATHWHQKSSGPNSSSTCCRVISMLASLTTRPARHCQKGKQGGQYKKTCMRKYNINRKVEKLMQDDGSSVHHLFVCRSGPCSRAIELFGSGPCGGRISASWLTQSCLLTPLITAHLGARTQTNKSSPNKCIHSEQPLESRLNCACLRAYVQHVNWEHVYTLHAPTI